MTAAELNFKIQATGDDQLKKAAIAVESVGTGTRLAGAQLKTFDATLNSLVSSGKTYVQALQEMSKSHGVLSTSVVSTSAALLKHLGIVEEVEVSTHKLVGANVAAGAAIRDLTGQSNIRGIENLLSNVLGLGSAFQSAFIFTGLVAAGEELYKYYEKFDPLTKATKALADENKKLDQTYVTATANIERYIEAQARATLGPAAAKAVAAYDAGTQRAEMVAGLADINRQIADKRKELVIVDSAVRQSSPGNLPGFGAAPNRNLIDPAIGATPGSHEDPVVAKQIETLQAKYDDFAVRLREFDQKKKADDAESAKDKKNEAAEAARPAAELAKRRAEELVKVKAQLAALEGKANPLETTPGSGVDAIIAKRHAEIQEKQDQSLLTPEMLAAENQITQKQVVDYQREVIAKAQASAAKAVARVVSGEEKSDFHSDNFDGVELLKALRKEISELTPEVSALMKAVDTADQSDADAAVKRLGVVVRNNQRAVSSGNKGGGAAANNDYSARITAANEILAIETRHLDLIEDKDKREEKLADARKKYADEVYQAEADHEEALFALREQDLHKYEELSGKIFDAITNRRRGAAFELRQLLKGEAMSTGKQIFSNLTSPILQTAGHALGHLTGGSNWGGILKGTALDPKNDIAKQTADHTKDTADNTRDLVKLLSGNGSIDPTTATGIAGTGQAAASAAAGSSAGGFLGTVEKILGLGKGISSSPGSGVDSSLITGDSQATIDGSSDGISVSSTPYSSGPSSAPMSVGSMVGAAATIAGGALAVAQGINKGGVSGDLEAAGGAAAAVGTAVSAVAKLVGALSPALAAAGPIGAAVGAGLGLISSLLPNSPEQRSIQIATELSKNQFLPNTAMNVTQGQNGTYEDFDSHGLLRTSTLSAVPTVAEPYITSQRIGGILQYADAPGSTSAPYSGGATGSGQAPKSNAGVTVVIQNLQTMDAQSFHEFLQKPSSSNAVGESLATHLQTHEGRASQEIRYVTGAGPNG